MHDGRLSGIAVFAGAALVVGTALAPAFTAHAATAPSARAAGDLGRLSTDMEALARRVGPAVVQVFVSGLAPAAGDEAGGLLSRQRGSGSGVIVDPQGFIVANAHVVSGARRVQVLLATPRPGAPGRSAVKPRGPLFEARIVGTDRETDLAVLKIEGDRYPALTFADSDGLEQGQLVFAFGSPLGLENSVSMGVISATVRQLEPEAPMIYLQTDAAIHPGNSGGPLIDVEGHVVGINTFIAVSEAREAVGFAAPSNIVDAVYRQIRTHGRVRRGEIGARAQTLTPELSRALGLARDWGVMLGDVYPRSPAEQAGLRAGDVVLTLDGKVLENGRQLDVNLYRREAGEEVSFEILREGEKHIIPVRLAERSGDLDQIAHLADPEQHLIAPLHILGLAVDARLASIVPMRQPWGVIVALSAGDAPPGSTPLLPGDIIRSADRTSVRTLEDLRAVLAKRKTGDWVVIHLERGGRMMYVPCEIP